MSPIPQRISAPVVLILVALFTIFSLNNFPAQADQYSTSGENSPAQQGCTKKNSDRLDCSSLQVSAVCEGNIAVFTILNTGEPGNGDMAVSTQYRLILDNQVVQTGTILLSGGNSTTVTWENGGLVTLQADQQIGHPGNSQPQQTIQCSVAGNTDTPVPPTETPTNTPVPPTETPTNTPVPPTETPTNTPVTPTATYTNTPVPPTATPTNTPQNDCELVVRNLNDSGIGSLRYIIACAPSGSTITFAVEGTIVLTTGELVVNKHLTIDGPGAEIVRISGNSVYRIFRLENASVIINDLTLQNGFVGMAQEGKGGGALINLNSTVTLENMIFSSNVTGTQPTGAIFGGAIWNSGTMNITNGEFLNNHSQTGYGGAIYNQAGNLTITDSVFSGNISGAGGGALCNSGVATIENSEISQNSSNGSGGGLFNFGTLHVSGTNIENNSAGNANIGGGIFNVGALTVNNSVIANNFAPNRGGGLFNQSGALSATVTDTIFRGNTSGESGGAIENVNGTLFLQDSLIEENYLTTLPTKGGIAIINYFGNVHVSGTTIQKHDGRGAAIVANGGTFSIVRSTITENSSVVGGAISLAYNVPMTIAGSVISLNRSTSYGGAISSYGLLEITDTTFDGNTALDGGGGAINNSGGTLTISQSAFTNNFSGSVGGGAILNSGPLTISSTTFTNNRTARYSGGAIWAGGNVIINDSVFSANHSGFDGGAIEAAYSNMLIRNTQFWGNSSANNGGALFSRDTSVVTIEGSSFIGNTTPGGGGGIMTNFNGAVFVTNSTLSGNHASVGGGIYNSGTANLNFVTITQNYNGGAHNFWGYLQFKNSVVAGQVSGPNCHSIVGLGTGNFANDDTCSGFTNVPSASLLGGLEGEPAYHSLLEGNPAIDAISDCTDLNGNTISISQNGVVRPSSSACDAGSYER